MSSHAECRTCGVHEAGSAFLAVELILCSLELSML